MESGYLKGLHAKSKWEFHVNRTAMDHRDAMTCRLPDIPETILGDQTPVSDPVEDVKRQVRFANHRDEERDTELTGLTEAVTLADSAESVMVTSACASSSRTVDGQAVSKRRRGSRGAALGPPTRAHVNRTDSEKLYCKPLSEVLFSMKSEGSQQYIIVPDLSTRCSLEEASYYSVEEMEYYDAPQSPVGRLSLTDGSDAPQQMTRLEVIETTRRGSMQSRRRSSFPDSETRLLFSPLGGEHEERILETNGHNSQEKYVTSKLCTGIKGVCQQMSDPNCSHLYIMVAEWIRARIMLRGVVRKCTNPDPARRPTASQILRMLTMTI